MRHEKRGGTLQRGHRVRQVLQHLKEDDQVKTVMASLRSLGINVHSDTVSITSSGGHRLGALGATHLPATRPERVQHDPVAAPHLQGGARLGV